MLCRCIEQNPTGKKGSIKGDYLKGWYCEVWGCGTWSVKNGFLWICVAQGRKQKDTSCFPGDGWSFCLIRIFFWVDNTQVDIHPETHKPFKRKTLRNFSQPKHYNYDYEFLELQRALLGRFFFAITNNEIPCEIQIHPLPAGGFRSPTVTLQYFTLLLGGNPRGLFTWSLGENLGGMAIIPIIEAIFLGGNSLY